MAMKKASEVTHQVERITPAIAAAILETNTKNRRLGENTVKRFAEQMTSGLWHFDGSPIRIDDKGDLIDGQHRLWAIIQSDTTQDFLVVRGVDEAAMATMDTGKSRNFADVLSMTDRSLSNVIALAANVGIIYRWEDGRRGSYLRSSGQNQFVPYPVLLDFFNANKEALVEITKETSRLASRGVAGTVFALTLWVFRGIDRDDADYFFERLHDGQGLEEGSGIYTLRRWMLKAREVAQTTPVEMQIAFFIKAWNAYRAGTEIRQLSWRRGGASPEVFPIPE